MTPRLFTTAEVEALIPKLAELMGAALERHDQAQALAEAIRAAKERIRTSGGASVDQRDWRHHTVRIV